MSRGAIGLMICLFTLSLGSASVALAGGGEIEGNKLNLSVTFTYFEDDPESWRPVFEEASRLLYNATNGQLQLGEVNVYTIPAQAEDIDIWVLDGNYGAFANVLGLGDIGHIYISQTHKSTTEPAIGQFGVVHELGHYAFGLYDEYKGVEPPPPGYGKAVEQLVPVPNQFCVTEDDPVASIMDGGTTVPITNQRTEFCTHTQGGLSTAHNDGTEVDDILYINAQQALNAESCWETIARIAGLTPPVVVDTSDPPGLEPIAWSVIPVTNRLAICVDRSASMYASPGKIGLAKEGADLIVDLLHVQKTVMWDENEVTLPGEELGIIAFSGEGAVQFPMRELVTEASRDSAAAAIESITPGIDFNNLATDIGAALQTALDEIRSQGDVPASGEAIVLFSDGGQNAGSDPLDLVPELLERNIHVYTVGTGPGVDQGVLMQLAEETGGAFYLVNSPEELTSVATEITAAVRAAGILESLEGIIEGLDESLPILIESFAEEVTFVLQWNEWTLDMVLTSPTGDVITVEDAAFRDDVEAVRDELLLYIRVVNPELGLWDARLSPVGTEEPIQYGLTVLEESRSVSIGVTTDQEEYDYPQPVRLRVDVVANVPVAGCEVTATVTRPQGDPITIPVLDDGSTASGDRWANDGVYNAIFSDFAGDGTYTFDVLVVCENGTGPDPNLPFVEDGDDPPIDVEPFTREAKISVEVQGVSEVIEGTLDFHPKTLNVDNPNGYVTCYVELPEPYLAEQIDVSTVLLNYLVSPEDWLITIGDHDGDEIQDLMLKFDRGDVIETLPEEMEVVVTMTGILTSGESFIAEDTIHLIHIDDDSPVTVDGAEVLVNGMMYDITWEAFEAHPISYSGYLSLDGGITWEAIFRGIEGTTTYTWEVNAPPSMDALILVQVDSPEGAMRQSQSEPLVILGQPSDVEDLPLATAFLGASPNPMRGMVTLQYALAQGTDVQLEVYDVSGRLVRRLVSGAASVGAHAVQWDGTDGDGHPLASGVYLYVFQAGTYRSNGRLMLVR